MGFEHVSIEYIEGTTNTCADLLSKHHDEVNETQDSDEEVDGDQTVLDVNNNMFEINVLDSNDNMFEINVLD